MLNHIIITVLAVTTFSSFSSSTAAQDRAQWDPKSVRSYLDDAAASVSGGVATPIWSSTDASVMLISREEKGSVVYLSVDLESGRVTPKTSETAIRDALELADDIDFTIDSFDADNDAITVSTPSKTLTMSLKDNRVLQKEKRNPHSDPVVVRKSFPIDRWNRQEIPSPDGKKLATLIGHDFGVRSSESDRLFFQTTDGTEDNTWYFAGDIWENAGSSWSPDGRAIVARRHDMRNVSGIPVVDYLDTNEKVSHFKYWTRTGQPLPVTSLVIFNAETGEQTPIDLAGTPDTFDFFVDWSPKGDFFAFIRYSRDIKRQELYFADASSGATRRILKDVRRDGWVKWPSWPKTIEFLPSGDGFLWRADNDGWFHWRHYDFNGDLINRVTNGAFPSYNVLAIDEDNGWVYFMASSDPDRPYDMHLNRVRFDGTGQKQLTQLPGQREVRVSPDFQWFIDAHSHIDRPPRTDLLNVNGEITATLADANVDMDFRTGWANPEEFTAPAADGVTRVHGMIFKPHNFDPNMSYPVIERVYGGMQVTATPRAFPAAGAGGPGSEYGLMLNYLNALGFVVVVMDAPGTPGRGRRYHLDTYGDWPDGVIADHAAALRAIAKTRPYMDMDRVGVDGNSWGGYIAGRALIDAPDLYRAGALSVPEVDLLDHSYWVEWKIGSPKDNLDHYKTRALTAGVSKIESDLLIVAGTSDVNVSISNTMKFLDALAEEGKEYDLVLFPGTNHPHQGRGDRYSYAVNKIGVFFSNALGGPEPRD